MPTSDLLRWRLPCKCMIEVRIRMPE
jgi:hypothetical protein